MTQRTKPEGVEDSVWDEFNTWADSKLVPAEPEDWTYLWECFADGAAFGYELAYSEIGEEVDDEAED